MNRYKFLKLLFHVWLIAWCIGISQRFLYESWKNENVYKARFLGFDFFFDWITGYIVGIANLIIIVYSVLAPPPSKDNYEMYF